MTNHILFFDGKIKYLESVQIFLNNEGITPLFALTNMEVIQKINRYSPSLIFINCPDSELNFNEINDVLKIPKKNNKKETPIILISNGKNIKNKNIINENNEKEFMDSIKNIVHKYMPISKPEKNINILAAEDDLVIKKTVEILLKKDGYSKIRLASDGKEAWDEFQKNVPDLVLLDYMMPYMTGYDILKKIRQDNKYDHIPIIFLTALTDKEKIIQALNAGATDYITKPFDQAEFLARVNTHARNYYLQKQIILMNKHLGRINDELSNKNMQIEADLRSARKIQESLLPKESIKTNKLEINFFFEPCQSVGGDFLNYFQLDEKHVGFYIADVSGHGVTSAMITVFVREQIRNIVKKFNQIYYTPAQILNRLNKDFNEEIYFLDNGVYFTIFFGIINFETYMLDYASAGHHAFPLIINNDEVEIKEISGTELAVGFLEDYKYTNFQIQLRKNDRLLLHTDGIIEITDENNIFFGMEKLKQFIQTNKKIDDKTILKNIVKEGEEYSGNKEQNDDIALMMVKIL